MVENSFYIHELAKTVLFNITFKINVRKSNNES